MLSAVIIGALAAVAQAQENVCVGESNGVSYTYCGRLAPFNFYWTPLAEQTNILFEAPDNGYHSFGFSSEQAAGVSMIGANVIFGCDDFLAANLPETGALGEILSESPWDTLIGGRAGADVLGGFDANNLAITGSITQIRTNGVCGIRFERLNTPDTLDVAQHIISGTANGIVIARGAADVPAIHDTRAFALQDFILNTGDISDTPIELIVGADMDGAASATAVSRLFAVVAAAVAAALW